MGVLLERLGWSQASFAKQVGANKNTVNAWCSGGSTGLSYRLAMKYLELLVKVMK